MRTLFESAARLPELCQNLLPIGLNILIQSTLLLSVGLLAGHALRRRSSVLQCLFYRATLVGVLVCALLSAGLAGRYHPLWNLSLPPARGAPTVSSTEETAAASESPSPDAYGRTGISEKPAALLGTRRPAATVRVIPAGPRSTAATVPDWPIRRFQDFLAPDGLSRTSLMGRIYVVLSGLWLGGATWLLAWLLLCCRGIRRICARSAPVADAETLSLLRDLCGSQGVHPPLLLVSADVRSVFLTGLRRPAILLPATYADDLDRPTLRSVLAHEVAHLAWRDSAWTLFTRLLCALGWIQPLLWIVCRRWEQASEEVCDLAVLQQDASARVYADCLLRMAERLAPTRAERMVGAGIIAFRSSLGRRVERLLARPSPLAPSLTPSVRVVVTLGVSCALVPVGLLVAASGAPGAHDLANDPRLEQRVVITTEGISLGELLPLLSRKTGVSLTASRYTADDKVIVFGPARPLKDVLADIAALFNDNWAVDRADDGKNRYTLTRDLQARRYEERLSRANLERLMAQLDAQARALQETPEELARRPESDPIRQALSNPESRTATGIFALLTPVQRAQLIQNWLVRLPVSALTPAQKDRIEWMFHGGDRFKPDPKTGFQVTEIPREQMDGTMLKFQIRNAWGIYRGNGTLHVRMAAPTGFDATVTDFTTSARFVLPSHGNPYTGEKVAESAPLPDLKEITAVSRDAWPDRLRTLAEKTGLPVVSDYYRSKPIVVAAQGDSDAQPPALDALDGFCRPAGYLWWTHGKSLFFRKRDWYNQQLFEVPDRWILALSRRLATHPNAPTFADPISLADLSLPQIVGLQESLGHDTDLVEMAGLREYLAVLAAAPADPNARLYDGVIVAAFALSHAVLPNLADPRQQALLNAFLDAYTDDLRSDKPDMSQFGFLVTYWPRGQTPGSVKISLSLAMPNTLRFGYGDVLLPLSLPDDRRDRTKVEVVP